MNTRFVKKPTVTNFDRNFTTGFNPVFGNTIENREVVKLFPYYTNEVYQYYSTTSNNPNIIFKEIKQYNIGFPYKRFMISSNDAQNMFNMLKSSIINWSTEPYTTDESDFNHQFNYNGNLYYICDNESMNYDININVLIDYFIEFSRVKASRKSRTGVQFKSVFESWMTEDNYVKTVIKQALSIGPIDPRTLREGVYRAKISECPHEKSTFILALYRLLLGNIPNVRIFDACAGYGDRMLAAMALENIGRYVGVEPNSLSHLGFREMLELHGNNNFTMMNDYMPDAKIEGKFDFAYISPPSYDSEVYSDDKGQSVLMWSNREEWLVKFLFASLHKCWMLLDNFKYLVIQSILSKEINAYIRIKFEDATFLGAISVKTGSGRNKPMWIWVKNPNKYQLMNIPTVEQCRKRFSDKVLLDVCERKDEQYLNKVT